MRKKRRTKNADQKRAVETFDVRRDFSMEIIRTSDVWTKNISTPKIPSACRLTHQTGRRLNMFRTCRTTTQSTAMVRRKSRFGSWDHASTTAARGATEGNTTIVRS